MAVNNLDGLFGDEPFKKKPSALHLGEEQIGAETTEQRKKTDWLGAIHPVGSPADETARLAKQAIARLDLSKLPDLVNKMAGEHPEHADLVQEAFANPNLLLDAAKLVLRDKVANDPNLVHSDDKRYYEVLKKGLVRYATDPSYKAEVTGSLRTRS